MSIKGMGMKYIDTGVSGSKPTLLKPCRENRLGVKGNVVLSAFIDMVNAKKAISFNVYINDKKSNIVLGMESPSYSMEQEYTKEVALAHIKSALSLQNDALRYWLNLFPSPASLNRNTSTKNDFWDFHSRQFKTGSNKVNISVVLDGSELSVLDLHVTSLPREAFSKVITKNTNNHYKLNDKTFDYMQDFSSIELLERNVNQFLRLGVSKAAALLFSTSLKNESDLNNSISVVQTHYDKNLNTQDIDAILPSLYQLSDFLYKSTNGLIDARERVLVLDEYLTSDLDQIEQKLNQRRKFINGIDFLFSLHHYGIPTNLMISHQQHGILALPYDGAIDSKHDSRVKMLVNNLLPEFTSAHEGMFNLKSFINNEPRLISSFSMHPEDLYSIYPSLGEGKSNVKSLRADAIDHHTTTLDESNVFNGLVDDLPTFDNDFFGNIKSEFLDGGGIKISGIQHKMLMNLYEYDKGKGIQVSKGNIPSTHIAKFPMLGHVDNLAVAEWLGLSLCQSAGLNTSKFQLVKSESGTQPRQVNTGPNLDIEDQDDIMQSLLGGKDISFNPKNDLFSMNETSDAGVGLDSIYDQEMNKAAQKYNLNMKFPPFIIVERFDIANTSTNPGSRFISQDFCSLAQRHPSKKYDYDMEGVAFLLKHHIKNEESLAKSQEHLLRLIVASMSVGNNDLHLKNLTLLSEYSDSGLVSVGISPVYDVLVAPIVSDLIRNSNYKQAMPLSNTCRPSLNQVIQFATDHLDIEPTAAKNIVREVIRNILNKTKSLNIEADKVFNGDPDLTDRLRDGLSIVHENVKHLMNYGYEKSLSNTSVQFSARK